MATSVTSNLFYFSLSLVLLSHASLASQRQCRIEKLNAQEPRRRVQSEAGFIDEYYDKTNEQFECAGVTAFRTSIQPGGLFLPRFYNSPTLGYVLQGSGIFGAVIPGCPETFQSFQQQQREGAEGEKKMRDEHQRVQRLREGDIVAVPAGVAHWCYNDGESPLVVINLMDISNNANQLDNKPMEFLLGGRERGGSQSVTSILDGFEMQNLADAMGIPMELVKKIRTPTDDNRGTIVKVKGELQVLRPSRSDDREEEEEERKIGNGLEQAVCNMRLKQNIRDPARAFVYNPKAGRITDLNNQNLPILKSLGLSAEWGSLKRNAIHGPYWTVNAHTLIYVTRGSCRCQVVDNHGKSIFDGDLHQDQLLVVPQNFAVLKQGRSDDEFQWVSFMTNDNAMVNQIVGRGSALKSMPVDVIMNSYRISREEARMVKENRGEEMELFSPRSNQRTSA